MVQMSSGRCLLSAIDRLYVPIAPSSATWLASSLSPAPVCLGKRVAGHAPGRKQQKKEEEEEEEEGLIFF